MEVIIQEMESTVRAVDGQALLHPQVLSRIIAQAIAGMKEHMAHERTVQEERKTRPGGLTSREVSFWE
jgi:hypothetical protein